MSTTAPSPVVTLPPASAGCSSTEVVTAGDRDVSLTVDGVDRSALVHVPASAAPGAPLALVLNFHGTISDPTDQAWVSGMSDVADAHGFVVAYPAGLGFPSSWHDREQPDVPDDPGFVATLMDELGTELCLDPRRTYATGFSAGAWLSWHLACRLEGRLAGIALVSPAVGPNFGGCLPARPIPTIVFHGLLDPLIPWLGGQNPLFEDVPPTGPLLPWTAAWAANNGCADEPVESEPVGFAVSFTWADCDAPTELWRLGDAGHSWPGGNGFEAFGKINHDIVASQVMWDFFNGD